MRGTDGRLINQYVAAEVTAIFDDSIHIPNDFLIITARKYKDYPTTPAIHSAVSAKLMCSNAL
jgi:hypothetical protein